MKTYLKLLLAGALIFSFIGCEDSSSDTPTTGAIIDGSSFNYTAYFSGKTLYSIEEGEVASITFDVDGTTYGVDKYGPWDDDDSYEVTSNSLILHTTDDDDNPETLTITYKGTAANGGLKFNVASSDHTAEITVYANASDRDAALTTGDPTPTTNNQYEKTGELNITIDGTALNLLLSKEYTETAYAIIDNNRAEYEMDGDDVEITLLALDTLDIQSSYDDVATIGFTFAADTFNASDGTFTLGEYEATIIAEDSIFTENITITKAIKIGEIIYVDGYLNSISSTDIFSGTGSSKTISASFSAATSVSSTVVK